MKVAIVVEGPSDKAAYPILINRIRASAEVTQVRVCGGKTKLKNTFIERLKEFQKNAAWNIERVFVIQDSDCMPHQQIEERLRDKLLEQKFNPQLQVHFFATKCALESWLLADADAISEVSKKKGKNEEVPPVQVDLDSYKEVKVLFLQQLSKAGLQSLPTIYSEIASVINLDRISTRCPSFRRFKEQILA